MKSIPLWFVLLFPLGIYLCQASPVEAQVPDPEFIVIEDFPAEVALGESITVAVAVRNDGGDATYGSISVSFPSFTEVGDADHVWLDGDSGDPPGFREFEQGTTIGHADGSTVTAEYLLAEFGDDDWEADEFNFMTLTVWPQEPGPFVINVRSNMGYPETGEFYNEPEGAAEEDQQGWPVQVYTVQVGGEPSGGLLAYYPLDGDGTDTSGNGNDGTVFGATPAADRFGTPNSALAFDGINDRIELGDLFDSSQQLTLAAWVKLDTGCFGPTKICGVIEKHTDASNSLKSFALTKPFGSGDTFFARYYDGGLEGVDVLSDTRAQADRWYFLVTTFDNGTARMYVDGVLEGETVDTRLIQDTPTPTIIGDNTSNNHPMDGVIDDVRVYDRVLTTTEVRTLCEEGGWTCGGVAGPASVAFYNVPFGPYVNGGAPLVSGELGSPGVPAKVAADGSTSTEIVITGESITEDVVDELEASLVADVPPGDEEKYLGTLGEPEWDGSRGGIKIEYTHPRLVFSATDRFRVSLRVRLGGSDLGNYPIDVFRAPVVMVHGLWGSSGGFAEMEAALDGSGTWPAENTERIGYRSTNSASFEDNAPLIRDRLYSFLRGRVDNGYSVGRTDYVGHSMGGILARLFIQNPSYPNAVGQINRLVTLNTPHAGSQAANFLLECELLGRALTVVDHNVYGGAVDDLRVDSDAILIDLNGQSSTNVVPSHSVATQVAWSIDLESFFPFFLLDLADPLCFPLDDVTPPQLLDALFDGESSDLVVSASSQRGGLTGSATSSGSSQMHVGSPSNPDVISNVMQLLSADTEDDFFTTSGFAPPVLTYDLPWVVFPRPNGGPLQQDSEGMEVVIMEPSDGAIAAAGETLTIAVTGSEEVQEMVLAAGNVVSGVYGDSQTGSSATFQYPIPVDAIGPIDIAAIGVSKGGYARDSIRVFAQPSAEITALSAYPQELFVSVEEAAGFILTGGFADGVDRDVTGLPGIMYEFGDEGVAMVDENGEVVGIAEGVTTLTATYDGQSAQSTVTVLQSQPPVASEPSSGDEGAQPSGLGQPYPNPTADAITVPFSLDKSQRVRIRVFDVLGRIVVAPIDAELGSGQHAVRVPVRGLASGVYIVSFEGEGTVESRRITVVR